jgi:hypothetical protein
MRRFKLIREKLKSLPKIKNDNIIVVVVVLIIIIIIPRVTTILNDEESHMRMHLVNMD